MDLVELDFLSTLHVYYSMPKLVESNCHVNAIARVLSSKMHFIPLCIAVVFLLSRVIEVDFDTMLLADV